MKKSPAIQNRSTKGDPITQKTPMAFADEKSAVEFMESLRWDGRPGCPRCGDMDVYQMQGKTGRQANYRWRCRGCKEQFTVRTGTVFEDSRIPMRHWCYAFWRASTSKKGVSALEIHRQTGVSYKSALFMLNRIRYAMSDSAPPFLNGTVEVDETYVGGRPRKRQKKQGNPHTKTPVIAMVQRGGIVKTQVVADVTGKTVQHILSQSLQSSAHLITDEHSSYILAGRLLASHETVNHSLGEYVRGHVTTNTVEGFFSIVKRGLNGIYHSVSKKHLHRYMAEFEFRYNYAQLEDGDRMKKAIVSGQGKRLTYRDTVMA